MHREIAKAQIQAIQDNGDTVERTDRIYKPSYTIEFNRVGEVLLYSCEPLTHTQVYLKYPYVFYESLIPLSCFMFYMNPFGFEWQYGYSFYLLANLCKNERSDCSVDPKSPVLGQAQVLPKKTLVAQRW